MASIGRRHHHLDILEIYATYRDIVSKSGRSSAREPLAALSKSLESRSQTRDTILDEILKLKSLLDLSVDSHQFDYFYDFVFFFCRQNGQKNISVSMATAAWRLVLNGRFRLLVQWCDFVEKHQRHNITEDTWQQLLSFSRRVNEVLEDYDPRGAWPPLIDDFVEHMYRTSGSTNCSTRNVYCSCDGLEAQSGIPKCCEGLPLLPGFKRKLLVDSEMHSEETKSLENSSSYSKPKRLKQGYTANGDECLDSDAAMGVVNSAGVHYGEMNKHYSVGCLQTSACAVEDSLSKGFEGHLFIGRCFQFDQKRVSYT